MVVLIKQGKDLVLDFSYWSKEKREIYRKLIINAGGMPKLIYMKADKELLKKRLQIRNQTIDANSPFVITDEILDHHYDGFQEPVGENEIVMVQE